MRLRIDISKILRIFEAEDWKTNEGFLIDYPQKTSKYEVRMRSIVLRFLRIPRKIQPKGAFINYLDRF